VRTPDPEAVSEALPIRWPEDVARLRREVKALVPLKDEEIDALYSQFSTDVYYAGWMNLDARPDFLKEFERWVTEASGLALESQTREAELRAALLRLHAIADHIGPEIEITPGDDDIGDDHMRELAAACADARAALARTKP